MKKTDFENKLFSKDLNTNIKGFINNKVIKTLKENSNVGIILNGMEYRPDKIAEYYYGDYHLSWMIDLANNFTEGIKEYYKGRKILIPNYDDVSILLSSQIER